MQGVGDMKMIDQKTMEYIISIVDMLDYFGRQIEQREEPLWARAKEAARRDVQVFLQWSPMPIEALMSRFLPLNQLVLP